MLPIPAKTEGVRHDDGCRDSTSPTTRSVFRCRRARCLRRRLRGPHQGREEPRHRAAGLEDPREPRPSRRSGRRQADGRRRRHPDPAARPPVPRRDGQAGRHAAPTGRVRRRHDLPAEGTRLAPGLRAGNGTRDQGRRPGAAGLARRAGQPRHADVAHRARKGTAAAPGLHRPRQRRDRAGRAGTQALRDPQDRERQHPAPEAQAQQGILRSEHVEPHRGLQGPAARRPGRHLLPRPAGQALRLGPGPGAPALLDQHLPRVAAGPPVPLRRAQRRDQHRQGQLQLDEGARGRDVLARAGPRPAEALPDQLRGPVRHRHLRQLPRAADDGRLPDQPGRDDDDSRALGTAQHHGPAPPRVL